MNPIAAGVRRATVVVGRVPARAFLTALAVAGVGLVPARAAWAHNVDELLQQVYVTPTVHGLDISVEMTPGSAVAPALLTLIDSDANQVMSAAEQDAQADAVRSALRVTVDGQALPVRLVHTTYPQVPLLLAGGGTIIVEFAVDIPTATKARNLRVSNTYAPTTAASGPLLTKVQANLTPDPAISVEIGNMTHEDDGRTLAVQYANPPLSPASSVAPTAATATANQPTPRRWGTPLIYIAPVFGIGIVGFILRSRRRRAFPT